MAQLSLERNAFERALDIYQVVFAELDSDHIRIAHQRRKLASAILDRDDFASRIENYLACSDFDSILTYASAIMVSPMTMDSERLQFQSIIDAGFLSQLQSPPDSIEDVSPDSHFTAEADLHHLFATLPEVQDSPMTSLQNTFSINDDQVACLPTGSINIFNRTKLYLTDDDRWKAVLDHDDQANGHFVYCVKTTGIYCRPTCPSRRPQRLNATFHFTNQEAENAGFRPCRRCKPQELASPSDLRQLTAVEMVKQEIQTAVNQGIKQPSLTALATKAGMSSFHFHRVFKARTGSTPEEYGKLVRLQEPIKE